MITGVITKGIGGTYAVRTDSGDNVLCQIRGGIRKSGMIPAVGDHVRITESGDPDIPYVLEKILPRKNNLIRPAVSNLDYILLTFAVKDPEPDLKLLDKMLIITGKLMIEPVIIFTKADLDSKLASGLYDIYTKAGYKCFISSRDNMINRDTIKDIVGSGFAGLAGPSGVGKSTICNHLLEEENMSVGDISDRLKRGKHTTRHVELFDFGDGFISDTPGFTSLDLFEVGIDYKEVTIGYPELIEAGYYCRFDDCRHLGEKDCSVPSKLQDKTIDLGRFERYKEFYENLYSNRNNYTGRRRL